VKYLCASFYLCNGNRISRIDDLLDAGCELYRLSDSRRGPVGNTVPDGVIRACYDDVMLPKLSKTCPECDYNGRCYILNKGGGPRV
jgi:hypothetical protein